MAKYKQNEGGYIVFEDGGINPIAYGATEKWFPTYDDAIAYAMNIVSKRVLSFKEQIDANSVIVYEGDEKILHKSHTDSDRGRVVFQWTNYKK